MHKATLTALLLLLPALSLAQQKTPIELFNEGSDLAEQGKLKEAVSLWVMVADDIPDKYKPTVQVNLGLAYKELKRPVEAWHHLSRYLASSDDAEVAGWRAELETSLRKTHVRVNIRCVPADTTLVVQSAAGAALTYRCPLTWWFEAGSHPVRAEADGYQRKVTMIDVKAGGDRDVQIALVSNQQYGTLVVNGDGRAVQVFLDGKLEGSVPFKRKIPTGTYELMVGAPGKMPWRKTITIEAGKTVKEAPKVAQKPKPKPVEQPPVTQPEVAKKGDSGSRYGALGWTLVGVGAAGLVGGAACHGVAFTNNEDLRSKYPDGTASNPQPASNRTAYDDGYDSDVKPLLIGAGVLYGVGAAAALTGTIFLLLDDGPAQGETQVQPIAAPGVMGMTFQWTF